jgi:hypothetical protein
LTSPASEVFNLPMASKSPGRRAAVKKKTPTVPSPGKQPTASRPVMPKLYGVPQSTKGLLDWSWAQQHLARSHNYVVVTVRPDGRPHAMAMHGLWFENAFYFGTSEETRKARNLAANPNCILMNEQLDELIILEGIAEPVNYESLPPSLSNESKKKYGFPLDPRMGGVIFKVAPRVVFALAEKQFPKALTRWKFQ